MAAMLLLGLGLSWCYDPAWLADYRTAIAEQRQWHLEDGSLIHAAPDSALDVNYSDHQRYVRLYRSEAWFQVVPDAQRPFIVEAAKGNTQALGSLLPWCLHSAF